MGPENKEQKTTETQPEEVRCKCGALLGIKLNGEFHVRRKKEVVLSTDGNVRIRCRRCYRQINIKKGGKK